MDMERGERGGVVLDGDNAQPEQGGAIDAAIDQTNQENNEALNVKGDATNPNGGAEVLEDGKVDGEKEGEIDPNGEGAGPEINPTVESLKEAIRAEMAKLVPQQPVEEVKPLSDEQWGKIEQEWGQPRQTIEKITQQNVKVVNKLMEYIDSKLARLESGDVIQAVSREPGFTDATRYRNDVQEFLQDYDPKHWSNPALIKRAVIYARGLNAGANIQKARADSEKNKKVGGAARPASPSGGIKRTAMPALNGAHREVANMMGSEAEYNKFRSRPSRQIE